MSHIFGEIRQLAFVVEDIDECMAYWASILGVGPFFIKRKITLANFYYRGVPTSSPCISIALANSGSMQIELIQQHDAVPSIYLEFLQSGRSGLQHVSSWVTCDEFNSLRQKLLASGLKLAQEGTIPTSGVRLAYFDTEQSGAGLIFEIADLKEPEQYKRVTGIAQAAAQWQGGKYVVEVTA